MMNGSIYISSVFIHDETPPTEKAKEKDDFRNYYNIWKAPGNGHCVIHCFGEQFDKGMEFVLQCLWYEISNSSHIYMEFGTYSSSDKLRSHLSKYIFDKSYECDTADLVFKALSRIYKCRVFIHQDKPEAIPTGCAGETFTNTIHLLHQKDHYDLLKLRNQNKAPESVTISQESLATLFS